MKQKSLKNKKRLVRGGVVVTLALAVCIGCFGKMSTNVKANSHDGTNRDWNVTLPHNNGNEYFKAREKETDDRDGWVVVEKMTTNDGVNIWFNTNKGNGPIKITDVRSVVQTNLIKEVTYESNYNKGRKVYMGIENKDDTSIFEAKACGIVNYK